MGNAVGVQQEGGPLDEKALEGMMDVFGGGGGGDGNASANPFGELLGGVMKMGLEMAADPKYQELVKKQQEAQLAQQQALMGNPEYLKSVQEIANAFGTGFPNIIGNSSSKAGQENFLKKQKSFSFKTATSNTVDENEKAKVFAQHVAEWFNGLLMIDDRAKLTVDASTVSFKPENISSYSHPLEALVFEAENGENYHPILWTGWSDKSVLSTQEKLVLRSRKQGKGETITMKDLKRCLVLLNAPSMHAEDLEKGLSTLGATFSKLNEHTFNVIQGEFEQVKPSSVSAQFYAPGEHVMAQYQIILPGKIIGLEISILKSVK